YSGNAVSNYVNSMRAWHTVHGLEWALNNTKTEALLKAASSLAPPQSKRPPREPYTVNLLISIRNHLDLTSPLHAAVFTCLTTVFYAMAHMGKLTTKPCCLSTPSLTSSLLTYV
ncbi:hypothetical protein PAXRUDRAFT_165485, partial [Paxillus rubicundulus Ve08.2h10]